MNALLQSVIPTNASVSKPNDSVALRAIAVLEYLVAQDAPVSLELVAHGTGLPKATAFRILGLLQAAGMLVREPVGKRWAVGPRLSALALSLWRHSTLRSAWQAALQEAVDETGESCNLTIREGNEVLYVDRVETTHHLRLHLEPGTRVPLHCTASGKLFLCQLDRQARRQLLGDGPLMRYTSSTVVDRKALDRQLDEVARTLVGTHDSELFGDSVAIAVPVQDGSGAIVAAVALHAPASRESLDSCMRFLPVLRRAAERVAVTMARGALLPGRTTPSDVPPARRRPATRGRTVAAG